MTASPVLPSVVSIAAACLAAPAVAGPSALGLSCTSSTADAYGVGDRPRSVAIGDLDGDLDLDLAVANGTSDDVSVLLGAGDGTFAADVTYGAGNGAYSVAIGDLDGDGDLDLAVANGYSDDVSVLLNDCESEACYADLDGDDIVGFTDLSALLAAWGTDPGGPPDFDGDGNVGVSDLLILLANWGPCP